MHRLPLQDPVTFASGWVNLIALGMYALFTWRAFPKENKKRRFERLHAAMTWRAQPAELKPLPFSWLAWVLLSVAFLAYQLAEGSTEGLPLLVSELAGLTLIFLLTLRYGKGSIKPKSWSYLKPGHDYWYGLMDKRQWQGLGIVIVALGLWFTVRVAVLTLALSVVVDWMAAAPTIFQASLAPRTEPWYAWSLNAIASAGTIYGLIYHGSWYQMIYPGSLLAMSTAVVGADMWARYATSKKAKRAAINAGLWPPTADDPLAALGNIAARG